ncbi:MAG: RimK/LysX family protein [Bacteroidia bacterium]
MLIITDKQVIGRKEKVDFPSLNLMGVDAKIDTGAYTSALHCHDVRVFKQKRKTFVSFKLLDPSHPAYNNNQYSLPLYKVKQVKSSFGHSEKRYIIKTTIRLFDELLDLELSLADRSKMEYPVLLGRKLLKQRYIVDTDRINLSQKFVKARIKKNKPKHSST